jgi:hypothetical protein
MEDQGFYGIALDGHGELCRVRASNPGHLLFTGLPRAERAAQGGRAAALQRLLLRLGPADAGHDQPRFNPMSYHNGSVWPHDTALTALGLSRYGERAGVVKLTSALFEAATLAGDAPAGAVLRLPARGRRGAGGLSGRLPAAGLGGGAVFMLLQACLGLRVHGDAAEVEIHNPTCRSASTASASTACRSATATST